jgi:hypothetical protein
LAKELKNKVREAVRVILQPIQKGILTACAFYNKILPNKSNYHFYLVAFAATFKVLLLPCTKILLINMGFKRGIIAYTI